MIGETVSHYRIDARLGEGGMGVVYAATDLRLRRQVAVKFCPPDQASATALQSLLAEARAASRLNHPNIAHIYDCQETHDGRPFFVMELVDGQNLSDLLQGRALPIEESLRIARSVASALAEAHRHGIVHRDIKPANIRITSRGEVKVLDFGIAKVEPHPATPEEEDTATQTATLPTIVGSLKGTPSYMSPEQASGQPVDQRSDLFSLGCVFYECLTGHRPFEGKSLLQTLSQVIAYAPPPPSTLNPSLPKSIDSVVARLLEKDPEQRFQTAEEFVEALDAAYAGRGWRPSRRLAIVAAAIIAGSVFAGYYFTRTYQPDPQAAVWFERGVDALRDGAYLTASKRLEQALEIDPNFALARARLAEAWFEMDLSERAKDEMLRARRLGAPFSRLPKASRLQIDAIERLLTYDRAESIARYRDMLSAVGESEKAAVLFDLGRAQERDSDTEGAIDSYKEALTLDPQSAAAWLRLGQIYRRSGGSEDTLAAFDQAEKLYEAASNAEGLTEVDYARGTYALQQERPTDAQPILDRALSRATESGNVQQQIRILLQLAEIPIHSGDLEQSRKLAMKAVDLARANRVEMLAARSLVILGQAHYFRREDAEAEKYLRQGLDIAIQNRVPRVEAMAQMALANLYHRQGRFARARQAAEAAAIYYRTGRFSGDECRTLIVAGRARRELGDLKGAIEASRYALEHWPAATPPPTIALAHENLGQVYLVQAKFREALSEFERNYELNAGAGSALGRQYSLIHRANAHIALGQTEAAEPLLREAEQIAAKRQSAEFLETVQLRRAELALASGRASAAVALARSLFEKASRADRPTWIARATFLIHALVNAGGSREALRLCSGVLEAASSLESALDLPRARTWCADAALQAGDRAQAEAWAAPAAEVFQRIGARDMHWQTLALLARLGQPGAAPRARAILEEFQREWQPDDYRHYLARPDIQRVYAYLGRSEAQP